MHTKLAPIPMATAKAHYESGRTVHAVSSSHPAVHHMAHPISRETTGGLSFNDAHKKAQGVMKARTGSPALGYHQEVSGGQPMTDASPTTQSIDSSPSGGAMDSGVSMDGSGS